MSRFLPLLLLLVPGMVAVAQEPLKHDKKTFKGPDGRLYIQKQLPVYLWLSTSGAETSNKYRLWSEETKRYSNPMYFDTEGYNTVRSPSAVDTSTHRTVYPLRDIIFEVYADGIAPVTKIDYGDTKLYRSEGKIHLGSGTLVTLKASDGMSGVENIYYSLDGSPFKPYKEAISIAEEKEYKLKYYAVDNVGNVEDIHEIVLVLDKSAPVTRLEIEGDKYEEVVSARSKIALRAEDKGIGVNSIYYTIDQGSENVYSKPIQTGYLSQDDHTISYYATDKVGNQEAAQSYSFYIDKTPPTIIEEILGNSFFSGGKEFSSGKSRLKLTSIDNKAGVKEIRYSVNGGEYLIYDKPVYLTQASGNIVIKSYALDNVNNRSISQTANERTSIPYIDLTGPDLQYILKGPRFDTRDTIFISKETSISLSGKDTEAGMNRIEYIVDDGNPKEYTGSFRLESEGFHQVSFTGFDNVDNTSTKSVGVKVDNTGPMLSHSFGTGSLRKEGNRVVYPAHTVLFLTATDNVTGFQKITYSINGSPQNECQGMIKSLPKGENDIKVIAYDKLGNSTELSFSFIIE